jgi:hypothetical protein
MIKYRFGNWSCWKDYCGDSSQTWTIKTMLSQNKNTWSEHFLTITNNNKGGKPYLKIARKVLWERYLKIIACRIPKTSGEKTNNWLKATSLKVIGRGKLNINELRVMQNKTPKPNKIWN